MADALAAAADQLDRLGLELVRELPSGSTGHPLLVQRIALCRDVHEIGSASLLMVATAGEGIVNRLLESLVPPTEWDVIERNKAEDKWIKLSELVGVTPKYSKGTPSFQPFLDVVRPRNRLVHFKHGKALSKEETQLATEWKAGHEHVLPGNSDRHAEVSVVVGNKRTAVSVESRQAAWGHVDVLVVPHPAWPGGTSRKLLAAVIGSVGRPSETSRK